ncbi:hypothetical protein GP475_11090 [Corynebacterium poyangense]|uniref:Uncharacterized protein n=1 Tax=Corynebacterium poyangense TaxID=2684405 RepID=A0A7H0SRE0_9CORY|nr:PRC-barrel domain-containing protein [Corynebacterium poyangense]MBZ8176549.1 hypothetical protein [Corynebacterium poyangense]QNQ91115.1 hypothetical protein GP475_11090 [Corynebacterium poyangense]
MPRDINDLANATAFDSEGEKLGSVKEVFINDDSGQPDFIEVGHGLLGMSSALVPLKGHRLEGEELHLAFKKDQISDAPSPQDDAHLTPEDQAKLYQHYGLSDNAPKQPQAVVDSTDPRPETAPAEGRPTNVDADQTAAEVAEGTYYDPVAERNANQS